MSLHTLPLFGHNIVLTLLTQNHIFPISECVAFKTKREAIKELYIDKREDLREDPLNKDR